MAWTTAQQKVIDTRNKNLLVSAAAGSGKTAVLVERIISMISEGEHPLDIDHLLVVTFTNAAAAEMRARIGEAIDRKLQQQPDNAHLQKQISLLQSAQITTIHSFCLNVIRNYFHQIDLDPSFKIAEEAEITLLKSDVISDLLERWYEEGRDDFHAFIESYSYSKSDAPIEELILQLFNFSMSSPWPKRWIEEKRKMFDLQSVQEMSDAPWMPEMIGYIKAVLGDLVNKNIRALQICNDFDGPAVYIPALTSDRSLLDHLLQEDSYEAYVNGFSNLSFDRLSPKKQVGVLEDKKDKVKELREEFKKGLKDISGQFFFQSPEEMLKDLQEVNHIMQVLFDLTLEFMEEFALKKEEKNLIDFNDLEHFALRILVDEQEQPTQAAIELSEQFDEILIDEYQDSNMVQETLLKSISREAAGIPNRFMVGDVKQSIYKFRLAMPEIFMEKYNRYSCEELNGEGQTNYYQRIDLDKNFRSRKTVLDYVNKIFEQIMQQTIGGIVYDKAASLKYGELFEETLKTKVDEDCEVLPDNQKTSADFIIPDEIQNRIASEVEILLVTEEEFQHKNGIPESPEISDDKTTQDIISEDPDEAVYTKKELEARAIANKIKALTDPVNGMLVFDKKLKGHRPAAYKDIVILLRSMSGWSEVFVNTLMQEGISAYADTGTGYFQTLEIITILNTLRIIDNPRQDIPLIGTLYSPIVGLTTTQLAMIRAEARNVSMYSALLSYVENGSDEELQSKVAAFLEQLENFRQIINHKPIHELIQMVLDKTGYYYYVCAMPGGDRRRANIDMLISQAVSFEKGSYSGLFHFIRYIEKLHKYEVDFGEASTSGEQDNTVRIMSIHKSKGLEFPIVFVAGMNKQFNTQDIRNSIVLHNELGIGPEYVDSKQRTKVPTLIKKVIQKKVQLENMGEELRVLYVALTRAREKLILTGYLKTIDEIKKKDFSFYEIMSAKSYLDWVLPATVNKIGWMPEVLNHKLLWRKDGMAIEVVHKDALLSQELIKQVFLQKDKDELLNVDSDVVYDQKLKDEVEKRLGFSYPYEKEAGLKVKMTVSELKKLGQNVDEEQSVILFQNPDDNLQKNNLLESNFQEYEFSEENIPKDERKDSKDNKYILDTEFDATVPNFISQKEVTSGTDRGTLYHKILELMDLRRVQNGEAVWSELNRLVEEKRLNDTDIKKLKPDYLKRFVTSNVAERMRKAEYAGKLYKEKQFVMGIKASEVMKESHSSELILIQGIIDVFFEENGELVLLDYKSDLVADETQLVKRYKVQLEYYRKALEQMLQKKVREMIIYSLPLGKEIRIDE